MDENPDVMARYRELRDEPSIEDSPTRMLGQP
jgi:hypothetical protein